MALSDLRGESSSASSSARSLLTDLSSPDLSFTDIAKKHNLTVEELTLLINTSDLRTQIATTETAACQRVRLVSSLNLHVVVRTLITVMDDFNALAKSHQTRGDQAYLTDPDYIRASDRARKAAWMLFRLSRITPIDEAALARARSRATIRDVGGRTGASSPSAPPSSSPPSSVALRDLCGESSSSPSASSSSSATNSRCSPASAKSAHATPPPSDLLTDSGSLDVHLSVENNVAPVPGSDLKDPEPGLEAGVSGLPASSSHTPQSPTRGRSPTKPRSPRYLVALAGSSP